MWGVVVGPDGVGAGRSALRSRSRTRTRRLGRVTLWGVTGVTGSGGRYHLAGPARVVFLQASGSPVCLKYVSYRALVFHPPCSLASPSTPPPAACTPPPPPGLASAQASHRPLGECYFRLPGLPMHSIPARYGRPIRLSTVRQGGACFLTLLSFHSFQFAFLRPHLAQALLSQLRRSNRNPLSVPPPPF